MSRRSRLSAIVAIAFLTALAPNELRADPTQDGPSPEPSKPAEQKRAERRSDSPRRRHDTRDGASSTDIEGIANAAVTALGIAAGIFSSVVEAYMQHREEKLDRHTPTDAWRETDGTGRSFWRLPLVGSPPDRYYRPDP